MTHLRAVYPSRVSAFSMTKLLSAQRRTALSRLVLAGVPAPFARSPLLMAALAAELGCHQVMSNSHPGITGTTSCKDTAAEKLRDLAPVPGQYRP